MNVNSIFLDPDSLRETGGYYGVVTSQNNAVNSQQKFTEQYINKNELMNELQEQLNVIGTELAELPIEADRTVTTTAFRVYKDLLMQVKTL